MLRPSRFDPTDKVILVTGGARGLGLELARVFVRAGARVAICARTGLDVEVAVRELASLAAQVSTHDSAEPASARVMGLVQDVTSEEGAKTLVDEVAERWGRLDVLVNNAGVILVGPQEEMTRDDFEREMKTHFWGPLDTIRAAIPHLRKAGGGRIVNISSIGGKVSFPHLLPYCATKSALTGLSTGLHAELARDGIVVTTVHPGLMRTGSPMNASFKGRHRQEYAWFSISDSLPFVSMNAERAANRIACSMIRGDAEVTLSLPAKFGVLLRALLPNLTAKALALTNELLPRGTNGRSMMHYGFESESPLAPSILTDLTQKAETRNNETTHKRALDAATAR